jgi:hypothetical protein
MNNKSVIGIVLLLLISTLAIGCVGSNEQKTEPTVVPTTIEPTVVPTIIEDTVVPTTTGGSGETTIVQEVGIEQNFLTYIFKINDERVMLDRNIQLEELATEEGTALINIDGIPYKLTYNIEQEINDRIIKITDLDGTNETVKVMVKYKNI